MRKVPVSVCIIAKNEEKHIAECLRRIKPYGFEVIVTDTGSTDRTREIAAQYADKVADFPWCDDFSAARNFCARHAANRHILALDCDEYLESCDTDGLAGQIRAHPSMVGALHIKSIVSGADGQASYVKDNVPRFYDRQYFTYSGTIHEQITHRKGRQPVSGMNFLLPMEVVHHGNAPIIVLTAYNWEDIEDEAKEAGITAFCSKPLFLSELRECLHSLTSTEEEPDSNKDKKTVTFHAERILLVEDNELNQEIAAEILQEAGFTVEIAGNGQIAVDMLEKSKPGYYQLILMDVQMPVMNGYEATRTIRRLKDTQLAAIPILAMTANAFEEDKQEALKSGMNGHIAKPINIDNLMNTLKHVLH